MIRKRRLLVLVIFLLLTVAIAAGIYLATRQPAVPVPTSTPEMTAEVTAEPTAAPDLASEATNEPEAKEPAINYFASLKLSDLYGNDFDASVFDGKPAMINIWTDWCGFCLDEMPALNRLAETYKDQMTLVGLYPEGVTITEDGKVETVQDTVDAGLAIYEDLQIGYPSLLPDETLLYQLFYSDLKVKGYPTTWFVGGDGMIYHIETSAHSEEDWIKLIDAVLAYMEEQGVAATP